MKSCYKGLKQLDSQRELYSGLDPIFLSEFFLLILKISSQILENFLWGTTKICFSSAFVLIYVNDMSEAIKSTFLLYADSLCILTNTRK